MKWMPWTLLATVAILSAPPAGALQAPTEAAAPQAQTVVFRLNWAEALAIEPTLRQLFEGELKIIAQHRGALGNELIASGSPQAIKQLTDLLKLIDRPAAAGGAGRRPGEGSYSGSSGEYGSYGGEGGYGVAYDASGSYGPGRRGRPASREQLQKQYDALERQAAEVARQARGAGQPDVKQKRAELAKVVAAAFAARQRLHEAELAALEARLASTRQTLAMRERIKDAIVERRVEDLLNPDARWEAGEAETPARPTTHRGAPPKPDNSAARAYRETLRQRWELIKQAHEQGEAGQDDVLRAASEYYAAEAAAATSQQERRAALEQQLEQLKGVKSLTDQLYKAGQATQSDLLAAQAGLLKAQAELAAEPGGADSPGGAASSPARLDVQVFLQGPAGATGVLNHGRAPLRLPTRLIARSGAKVPLRLDEIPGHAGLTLYGTLAIADVDPRTKLFLQHNAIPLAIAEEDIDQAAAGNLVTKVVYLPHGDNANAAAPAVESLVSTRLDPGADPLTEAERRGHVLATLRLGNRTETDEPALPLPTPETGRGRSR